MWSPQRQAGTTKLVGSAYTVKYVSKEDPAPKLSSHYVSERDLIVDSMPPDVSPD